MITINSVFIGALGVTFFGSMFFYFVRKIIEYKQAHDVELQLWEFQKRKLAAYLLRNGGKPFNEKAYEEFYKSMEDYVAAVAENHPEEVRKFCEESRHMWDEAIKAVVDGKDKK